MATITGELEGDHHQSLGARYFHGLCDRREVPKRERSTLVQELLQISYHAAHRRVTGAVPWTFEELAQVAAHFGETLDDVVLGERLAGATQAVFVVGPYRAQCQIWLGDPTKPTTPGHLVAHRVGTEWVVTPSTEGAANNAHAVRSLLLSPTPETRKRVAVLDDQQDIVTSVCEYLRAMGFEAHPFTTFEALAEAREREPFDAYVLDWLIGSKTARHLIAEIREHDKSCAIAVLTGQIETGKASASEVADALASYGAQPFMKPIAMPMLAATLSRLLQGRESSI